MDVHLVSVKVGVVRVAEREHSRISQSAKCYPAHQNQRGEEIQEKEKKTFSPVGIVHSDRLFSRENLGSVSHHTRLVQRRLSVKEQDVAILEVSVDLLVDGHRAGRETLVVDRRAFLGREKLVGDGGSLLGRELVL